MNEQIKEQKKEEGTEQEMPASSYPRGVRITAMAGVVLLVLLYIVTLIAALTTSPASGGLFKACLGASILIPIMLWLYIRFAKLWGGKTDK